MTYDLTNFDAKLAETREWLTREMSNIRTGRAAPALLEAVFVNAYGSSTPLKQVASVSVEDARTLRVSPYDSSLIKEIEKAIAGADLGVGTSATDSEVRVTFPELTAERRQDFVKLAKGKLEDARIAARTARDEAWNEIQEQEREGELTEDDKYRLKDELQKKIDTANDAFEEGFKKKEAEIAG